MISSERSQNIIVTVTIIAALASAVFLAGNVQYYGGSYALAGRLEVEVASTTVSNIDPSNSSVFPGIAFVFNMHSDVPAEGNVRLHFLGASVSLNGDQLSYTSFRYDVPYDRQLLYPNYNENFTLGRTTASLDRDTVLLANSTGQWHWEITFRYYFTTFDEANSITWRYVFFNWTGATTIL
ncbi:MAG: hypothetical protein ACFFCP_07005 [Promethearchaeota archaeon]